MHLAVLANIALEYPTIYPRKITCSVILVRVARKSHTLNQIYFSVDSVSHVMLDLSKKRLEMVFHFAVLVLLAFGHGLTPVGVLASLECPRKMGMVHLSHRYLILISVFHAPTMLEGVPHARADAPVLPSSR
jgi:hypothetical protein